MVALALALSACGLVGGEDAGSSRPADTADPGDGRPDSTAAPGAGRTAVDPASATFVEQGCPFQVPIGTTPRCGTVTVPENWATGAGSVTLAVAVFPSTAPDPAPDPVVYLDGGPGASSLDSLRFLTADMVEPLRARGDAVFLDQRGVGHTAPRLDCAEVTAVDRSLENMPEVPDDEATARFHDALRACRARLEGQGIDLSAYNSINSAHDVEAVRAALGFLRWNLYGISYGTRLALEVMRQHPGGIRAAVIDSVYPPEVDATRDNPASFVASYQAVVAACAQEPACRATGDLGQRFRQLVATYDAKPVEVEVHDYLSGDSATVSVDGETIVGVVTEALYSPSQFTDLPELATELERGQTAAIEQFLSQSRTQEGLFSSGDFFAFECNEEIAFADPAAVAAALPPDPFGRHPRFDYAAANTGPMAFGTCDAFGSGHPDPVLNQPVTSGVPTLLLAGAYDPVTPVAWAREAASHLSASQLVVDPVGSHGISPGVCGMAVVRQFLDAPTSAPDASCYDQEQLHFLAGPDPTPVMEPATYPSLDGSLTVTTVRPTGWVASDLDGDWLRQTSFLDPTELIQLAGDQQLADNLANYLNQAHRVRLSAPRTEVRGGRSWQHRTGASGPATVEWYQGELNGHVALVVLVAPPAEAATLQRSVLEPALDNIDVKG